MAFNPTSPLSGVAVGSLLTPTYTLTADVAPNAHSEQYAVTALGGTQTGVNTHSVSEPFTLTMFRPATFKQIGVPNPVTGVINSIPFNVYKAVVRKGVTPAANQSPVTAMVKIEISVPAGAEAYDDANVEALMAAAAGLMNDQASGITQTIKDGLL